MNPDANRLRDRTLALCAVESPTGDTADAARLYAGWCGELGFEVELLDDVFPATPTVVARVKGGAPGPSVVLCAHLDTVPIPHAPPRIDGDRVYGRGSADMKGAAISALEAAQVLKANGGFEGELVLVLIGLHEAPGGRGEDLTHLLTQTGFTADYAVVCEMSGHDFCVAHMGQATAEITVTRPGMPTHELQTPLDTPHPLVAAAKVVEAMYARRAELAVDEHPWVGAETYFVGEVHGGDFYNRWPAEARIVGTRRWAPGNTLEAVDAEFRSLLEPIAAETGCDIDLDLRLVRGAYEIDFDHELSRALREAYTEVTGKTLEPVGKKVVADAAVFAAAGIPTVYHGPVGSGAHADVEYMEVAELVRASSVYLAMLRRLLA
jgi:acetylornithine deacetylase/succinyl-diaminopimelate desuccinylase-like protein